jgi:hypothetical protein
VTPIRPLAALAAALVAAPLLHGQSNLRIIDPIDSLRNMREIAVVVEDLPVPQGPLTAGTLEAGMKRRLRQAGVDVPADDSTKEKDPVSAFLPYLYANINVITTGPGEYACSLSLQFKRPVEVHNIDRNRNFIFATTWERAGLALVPLDEFRSIQSALDELMSAFLDDHARANLK